jgi:hypothetical protein
MNNKGMDIISERGHRNPVFIPNNSFPKEIKDNIMPRIIIILPEYLLLWL